MSVTCVFASAAGQRRLRFVNVASIPAPVQPDDIVAARELLSDVISPTPLLYSRVLSEEVGGPVYFKCENLQRTGSFKVRGGYVRIARLSDADRSPRVVAPPPANPPPPRP